MSGLHLKQHTLCMANGKKTPEATLAGVRIKEARRHAKIDRRELERRTRIQYSTLGNYEQGLRELPIREAKLIEKATGIPAAYLLGVVDEADMELLRAPREFRVGLFHALKAMAAPEATPKGGEKARAALPSSTY